MARRHWRRIKLRRNAGLYGLSSRSSPLPTTPAKFCQKAGKIISDIFYVIYGLIKIIFYVVTTTSLLYVTYLQYKTQEKLALIEIDKNTERVTLQRMLTGRGNKEFPSVKLIYNFDRTLINYIDATEIAYARGPEGGCWVKIANAYNYDPIKETIYPSEELTIYNKKSYNVKIDHVAVEVFVNLDRNIHSVNRVTKYFANDKDYDQDYFDLFYGDYVQRDQAGRWASIKIDSNGGMRHSYSSEPLPTESQCKAFLKAHVK